MSQYGLGVELTLTAVRWATATSVTEVAPAVEFSPDVAVFEGRVVGGAAGAAAAADVPGNVVSDVVGQFTVDRLWFVGSMMLTPDDALRALLAGCVEDARQANGAPAGAVTISCPSQWDESAFRRLRTIVDSLGLVLPAARLDASVTSAAGDAASRLPERPVVETHLSDLPPLPMSFRPLAEAPVPIYTPPPTAAPRRRRWGLLAWAAVVLGIPTIVLIVVRAGREDKTASTTSTDVVTNANVSDQVSSTSETTGPAPVVAPLTIGVITGSDAGVQDGVVSEVAALSADAQTFSGGVFVVIQPADDDLAATIDQLRGQSVTALITAAGTDTTAAIVAASGAARVPLCLVGAAPTTDGITGTGIAIGSAKTCTDLLALGSIAASSADSAKIIDAMSELIGGGGLKCSTVPQCAIYLRASQPISFEPDGESIQLAPKG